LEFLHNFYFSGNYLAKNRTNFNILSLMSRHPSFKPPGGIAVKRNVLKRFERVELLRKRGQWKEGDRVVSLVKTKPEE
jgi:small basic protein (TIGR04137 family)